MSKKQKRRVSGAPSRPAAAQPAVRSASPASPASSSRPGSSSDFNPDYSYVMADLKKIGILAVSFTAILVVLSFILK